MYRVIFDDSIPDQIAALPIVALPSFAEALEVLEFVPANGRPYNDDKPDGPMREWMFGPSGAGSITYLLIERQREVHVLLVQWVG